MASITNTTVRPHNRYSGCSGLQRLARAGVRLAVCPMRALAAQPLIPEVPVFLGRGLAHLPTPTSCLRASLSCTFMICMYIVCQGCLTGRPFKHVQNARQTCCAGMEHDTRGLLHICPVQCSFYGLSLNCQARVDVCLTTAGQQTLLRENRTQVWWHACKSHVACMSLSREKQHAPFYSSCAVDGCRWGGQ